MIKECFEDHSHGAAQGNTNCVKTPNRFIHPNALPQYCIAPLGPNAQSKKATTTGTEKCNTPYGSQARISSRGCVNLVWRSDMFAPYSTDSRAGRRATWMVGLCSEGMNRAEKNVMTHTRTGVAGKKNWFVTGMSIARE